MQMPFNKNTLAFNKMREVGVGVEKLPLMAIVNRILRQMDRQRDKTCIITRTKPIIPESSSQNSKRIDGDTSQSSWSYAPLRRGVPKEGLTFYLWEAW